MNKLYITEEEVNGVIRWYLSYEKPKFQGGETIEIDEETAKYLSKKIK